MARIDRLIDDLFREDAERLILVSGEKIALDGPDGERALTNFTPSRAQVLRVVEGILPSDAETGVDSGSSSQRFHYASPSGRVEIVAAWDAESLRVAITPAAESDGDEAGDGAEAGDRADAGGEIASGDGDPAGEETADGGTAAEGTRDVIDEDAASDGTAGDGAGRVETTSPGDAPAIERLFHKMVAEGCSDLHVSAENAPLFRKDGEMVDLGGEERLTAEQAETLLLEITPERNREEFESTRDTDFAYAMPGVARFRCNLFMDRKGMGGVFRQIPSEIMTAEDLGLARPILELCELTKGLVVVTGPTGSGKSTTLAAMIDYINKTRREHIITIEDPIEFVHQNLKCLINQREVGVHTESFKVALRAALREDPDIVLVGELRDLETVKIALETAETGHLVFGTLHTNTAPSTVGRIIDQFPADQQAQIRTMLSTSLKGVIAQTLCRRKEGGRMAALEVLLVTSAVSNLIRENKTFQIPSVMQTARGAGMTTLNDALLELVREDEITAEEAYRNAVEKSEFESLLERNGFSVEV